MISINHFLKLKKVESLCGEVMNLSKNLLSKEHAISRLGFD